jgi:hypothetical protein
VRVIYLLDSRWIAPAVPEPQHLNLARIYGVHEPVRRKHHFPIPERAALGNDSPEIGMFSQLPYCARHLAQKLIGGRGIVGSEMVARRDQVGERELGPADAHALATVLP